MKRYILTGTPGAGKTSITQNLKSKGYSIIEEAATDVIAQQQAQGVAEPWTENNFINQIVQLQKQRQSIDDIASVQFHDRSALCCYALSLYLGQAPSTLLLDEIKRLKEECIFEAKVFFIQNIGFCEKTAARKISFEESLVFEQRHVEAYTKFGYELVTIPKASIENRTNFILDQVSPSPR